MARAKVVLPAPRSPASEMKSPGSSMLATSAANRRVASSFASTSVEPGGSEEYVCIIIRPGCPYQFTRAYSAESRVGSAASGKVHTTVVPCPGTESIRTAPWRGYERVHDRTLHKALAPLKTLAAGHFD